MCSEGNRYAYTCYLMLPVTNEQTNRFHFTQESCSILPDLQTTYHVSSGMGMRLYVALERGCSSGVMAEVNQGHMQSFTRSLAIKYLCHVSTTNMNSLQFKIAAHCKKYIINQL